MRLEGVLCSKQREMNGRYQIRIAQTIAAYGLNVTAAYETYTFATPARYAARNSDRCRIAAGSSRQTECHVRPLADFMTATLYKLTLFL
jgi:hypothetical protein